MSLPEDIRYLREKRLDEEQGTRQDFRSPFQRDYGRLIHSPAFRRLQGKSQVFGAGSGDYFRTRLTHSIEVAQIARQVAYKLLNEYEALLKWPTNAGLTIDPEVVECAALAHDLGHPPYGHKGEQVLDSLLKEYGLHYEGNAQNFRILMFLEKRTGNRNGLNLTAAVLLATNKYPYEIGKDARKKGIYSTEWHQIKSLRDEWGIPSEKITLEAQLMDLCDDIAYSTHDIEDGIKAGKINITSDLSRDTKLIQGIVEEIKNEAQKYESVWHNVDIKQSVERILKNYQDDWNRTLEESERDISRARRDMKATWVHKFATKVGIIKEDDWYKVTFISDNKEDLDLLRQMIVLKKLAWVTMVKDLRVQRLQKRSEKILKDLWSVFMQDSNAKDIIPIDWYQRYLENQSIWRWQRVVADYLAGMTDSYAEKIHGELFGSKIGSIYEME
ncbi:MULTISPECIES: deoxyguanosinetriphosphate triphosphohydrolase family protein [Bacillales]|jgi:dGTPase|uniref:deoxyguanosinetriphosphate triphosphohydrolase family protein n=1 Tax=Brevibacillus TaxID=55080 RepID=UPI001491FDCE|nr:MULTISPECIES: dNTP triphosphohydrolase [Bacillales]MBR8661256.1 dNTP triphosphohydrolase [Brevibacillus sp. NL20B1]MDT3415148.1 dGTPase [Brevibacillus aydinogluensis]NNV01696.1 dNTP triphosphohydrolase [Brevibacillus sp. MCWH]UFJ60929.1 dNTP triphosphohydrolase [Anoxybacillus sediminis]